MEKSPVRSTASAARASSLREFSLIFGIALAYFLAHRIAFFVPDSADRIMLIWPAGGIALAAFLMNPRRLWPQLVAALYLAGICADFFFSDRSLPLSFGFMTANMMESTACAYIILRFSPGFQKFAQIPEVAALIVGAVAVNAVTAFLGAGTAVLFGANSFANSWLSWYVSDGLGILLVAPFVVVWVSSFTAASNEVKSVRGLEFLACMAVWSLTAAAIFYPFKATANFHIHPYVLVALLAWPAVRFGQRGVTTALMLLFAIAVFCPVSIGGPPFWGGVVRSSDSAGQLLDLQLFLGFLSVVGYLISAGYISLQRAEEDLRKSNRQYDDVVAHVSVGIYLLHTTSRGTMKFEYVSPRLAKILGASKESILADPNAAFACFHPDDLPRLRELNDWHIRKGITFDWEGRVQVDGKLAWLHIVSIPEPLKGGDILWHGIVDDITERILAQKRLVMSEERFRAIWDKSFDGMRLIDKDGTMVMVNDAFCRQIGKPRTELEGKSLEVVYDHVHGQRIMDTTVERFRSNTVEAHVERMVTLWDGRDVWFELSNSIIELGTGSRFLLSIFRDMTERRRAAEALRENEGRLRAMFQASRDAIGVSKNGIHIFANPAYLELFGFTNNEAIVGSSILNCIAPSHCKQVSENVERRYAGDPAPKFFEARGMKANSSEFDGEFSVSTYELNDETFSVAVIRDVTERKQAEEALRSERQLLRTLIDNIPDSIYSKDVLGRKTLANTADLRNMGARTETEVLGKNDLELYPKELSEKFIADDRLVLASGQPVIEREEYVFDENGERRWFLTTKLPLRDKEGRINGLLGIGRNITAHKRAEKALRESQELFSAFMSHSPVYMYVKEVSKSESRVLQASENFDQMIGVPGSKMAGKTMSELFPAEFAAKMTKDDWAVASSGKGLQLDEELNGRHYTTIKFPIALGERTLLAGYTIDITERKKAEEELRRSEERFRTLYENSSIGLYRTSPDGDIILANPTLVNKLGYTSFEELAQRNLKREGFEPSYERETFVERVEREGGVSGLESAWTRRDGSVIHVRESARASYDENGKVLYYDGTVEDITERKEAEQRLRASEERYRSLFDNAPVGVFYSTMEGNIARVNSEYARIMGYSSPDEAKESINNSSIGSSVYADSGERVRLVNQAASSPGEWLKTETKFRKRDGELITANLFMRALPGQPDQLEGFLEDITERKKAELALRESERRFKSLFENSPAGVALVAPDGHYLEVNRALSRIYGYPAEELLRSDFLDITDPRDRELSRRMAVKVLEGKGNAVQFTKRYLHHDGHVILAEVNSSSIYDASDKPLYFITHVSDITERKQQEEKSARLSAIVESSDDIIISKTLDGIITSWNKGAETVYGYTEGEMIGKPVSLLIPPENVDELPQILEKVRNGKPVEHYETVRRKKDGKCIDVSLTISPIKDSEGANIGASTIGRDITERKKSELKLRNALADAQRFQEALDYVPAYIYMKDSQSRYIYANQPTIQLFGCTPEQLIGAGDDVFFPVDTVKRLHEIDARVFVGEQTMEEIETVDKSGQRVVYWEIKTPIYFDAEKKLIWGLLGISTDITERKSGEEALRRAQKLESIGTLAGGIAHDFNNLLNAMLGQSTLAIGKLPNESPARYHIEKSIQAADRAADLTRQLLAYSGKGRFVTEDFDLNRLVEENAQLLGVSVPKTTQMKYDLEPAELTIHGDTGQLQQVIMNLIINAGEAMGPNPGYITVRTGRVELAQNNAEFSKFTNIPLSPGSYALFNVADTGGGMSPEVLTRIFDPFFTTKFTGRGLGLAAVLGIIRGHKGGVRIKSAEGKGTEFEIILPLADAATTKEVQKMVAGSSVDGGGRTVLVIDDESFVLDLLTDVFTDANFKVLQSQNPSEGIEIYRKRQHEIEVVILDYSMPGMDGKAAFDELVKINKEVAVLLCSGYTEEEMKSAFGNSRPLGFIKKPYRPSELLDRVSRIGRGSPRQHD